VKHVSGVEPSRNAVKLGDLVEKMAAENSILQARIKGLQNAVVIEKKRRKRGKPCIKNIRTINEGKATFWSPTKLETTKQAIRDEEATKQQIALEKAQAKIQKQEERKNNEKVVKQRRQDREKLARQKKQAKDDKTAQRLASLQLKKDLQQQVQSPTKQSRGLSSKKRVTMMVESSDDKEVVKIKSPRLRRQRKAPAYLTDYIVG
jgi:hypothetical protein